MVDFIKNSFADWAKYQPRPIGSMWERFAERVVGVDDSGNVVYTNDEVSQVEDDGGTPRNLSAFDNTFGGVVFGDTGVPFRLVADAWSNIETYDGADSRIVPSYAGTPSDDDCMYYDTGDGEWKVGQPYSLSGHDHDSDYVNTVGGDSMQGPFTVSTNNVVITLGDLTLSTGNIGVTAGNVDIAAGTLDVHGNVYLDTSAAGGVLIGAAPAAPLAKLDVRGDILFSHGNSLVGRNSANDDNIDIATISGGDYIIIGETGYHLLLQASTSQEFVICNHHSTDDYLAPFDTLATWTDAYVAAWDDAANRFKEVDPATLGTEWDKILDHEEFLKAKDSGGTPLNMVGIDSGNICQFGTTSRQMYLQSAGTIRVIDQSIRLNNNFMLIIDENDDTAFQCLQVTSGDDFLIGESAQRLDAYIYSDDLYIDCSASKSVWLNSSINLPNDTALKGASSTPVTGYNIAGISDVNEMEIGHTTFPMRFAGSEARPQYNSAELAMLTDIAGSGVFLPLTAGPTKPLTGNLHIETASAPSLYLREDGTADDHVRILDSGGYGFLRKVSVTGNATLVLEANPSDNTGSSEIRFGRETETTGGRYVSWFRMDGTANYMHRFNIGAGTIDMCQTGGGATFGGNLYLDKTESPSIFLREAGSTTSYMMLEDQSIATGRINKHAASGNDAYLQFNATPDDGTSNGYVQMFKQTVTTGTSTGLNIYVADGSATIQHYFRAVTGDVSLCQVSGNVTIGEGHLYLDKTTQPTIRLREGGSENNYSHLQDVGNEFKIQSIKNATDDHSSISLDATCGATKNSTINIGYYTDSTSLNKRVIIWDGTAVHNMQHVFNMGTGVVDLCLEDGYVQLGGDLYFKYGTGIHMRNSADTDWRSFAYMDTNDFIIGDFNSPISIYGDGPDLWRTYGILTLYADSTVLIKSDLATVQIYGTLELLADSTIPNTFYHQAKEDGGTARNVLGMNGSNVVVVGNDINNMTIDAYSLVSIAANLEMVSDDSIFYTNGGDIYLGTGAESGRITGRSGGSYCDLIQIGGTGNMVVGSTTIDTDIRADSLILLDQAVECDSTLEVGGAANFESSITMPYNTNFRMDDDGGTPVGLLVMTSNDLFRIGNASYKTGVLGISSAAADPSTSHFGTGQWGVHKNTSSGITYFVYNDGGSIKKVALA